MISVAYFHFVPGKIPGKYCGTKIYEALEMLTYYMRVHMYERIELMSFGFFAGRLVLLLSSEDTLVLGSLLYPF